MGEFCIFLAFVLFFFFFNTWSCPSFLKLFLHYLFIVVMFWVGSSFQMFVLPNQMCTLDASHALRSCIRCAIHAPERLLHLEMRLNITPLLVLCICSKYNSDIHCLFADVTGLHNFLLVR